MKYVFLRTLFLIVFVFQSILTLTAATAAAVAEAAPDYADRPTVWCQYSVETVAAHRELMGKLPEIASLGKEIKGSNFAAAFLNGKLLQVGEGDSALCVFTSNHIHDFAKGTTYDCHRSRGFPKGVINEVKRVGTIFSTIKLPAPRGEWFAEFTGNLARLKTEVVAPSEIVVARYCVFDALENDYLKSYPFVSRMKETYPCFDSEASIARYVTFKLESEDFSSLTLLELRIHSRFNPCFFCVQMLHYYAQRWSEILGKPVRVFVSSQEEYHMPADIMPEGHTVPVDAALEKQTMRLYGCDEHYDAVLLDAELESFTYLPDRPGKIIQTFLPMVDETAPAATAAASE